jgi:hypothetical protein
VCLGVGFNGVLWATLTRCEDSRLGPRPDRKLSDPDQGRLHVDFRMASFADSKKRAAVKVRNHGWFQNPTKEGTCLH